MITRQETLDALEDRTHYAWIKIDNFAWRVLAPNAQRNQEDLGATVSRGLELFWLKFDPRRTRNGLPPEDMSEDVSDLVSGFLIKHTAYSSHEARDQAVRQGHEEEAGLTQDAEEDEASRIRKCMRPSFISWHRHDQKGASAALRLVAKAIRPNLQQWPLVPPSLDDLQARLEQKVLERSINQVLANQELKGGRGRSKKTIETACRHRFLGQTAAKTAQQMGIEERNVYVQHTRCSNLLNELDLEELVGAALAEVMA